MNTTWQITTKAGDSRRVSIPIPVSKSNAEATERQALQDVKLKRIRSQRRVVRIGF